MLSCGAPAGVQGTAAVWAGLAAATELWSPLTACCPPALPAATRTLMQKTYWEPGASPETSQPVSRPSYASCVAGDGGEGKACEQPAAAGIRGHSNADPGMPRQPCTLVFPVNTTTCTPPPPHPRTALGISDHEFEAQQLVGTCAGRLPGQPARVGKVGSFGMGCALCAKQGLHHPGSARLELRQAGRPATAWRVEAGQPWTNTHRRSMATLWRRLTARWWARRAPA